MRSGLGDLIRNGESSVVIRCFFAVYHREIAHRARVLKLVVIFAIASKCILI